MFLFEALIRCSKFIKNILSSSEDIKKCRLNFHRIECTQPSNIRISSYLDRERVLHFNERSSKYTLPPAQWPSTFLQECVIFDNNSSCISRGHFFWSTSCPNICHQSWFLTLSTYFQIFFNHLYITLGNHAGPLMCCTKSWDIFVNLCRFLFQIYSPPILIFAFSISQT